MKTLFMVVLMSTVAIGAQEREPLEITAPVDFIDFNQLEQSVATWREQTLATLSNQEIELVKHFIHLGSLCSLVELQTRQAVRELLPIVWQLQQDVTAGKSGLSYVRQIESHQEKFHQLMVKHDMLLEEWRRWTNALEVIENQKIVDSLEGLNEQVRIAIERCLGAGEWQYIAGLLPEILEDSVRAGNLLNNLCTVEVNDDEEETDKIVQGQEGNDSEPEYELDNPVVYFSWLTNAANLYNTRSWESIESVSQLLRYQEELISIGGVIFNRYLRALDEEMAIQEMCQVPQE